MDETERDESVSTRAADHIAGDAKDPVRFVSARKASTHYSRFVFVMRYVLPAVALALVVLVIAWSQMEGGKGRFRLNFASVSPDGANTLKMEKPRFTGVDADERPFTVTANAASQAKEGSSLINLDSPVADVTLQDGTWVALRSTAGIYNQRTGELELSGEVNLFHDQGYEFQTSSAFLNLQDGKAYGRAAVRGQGPFGQLKSDGFQVTEHGKIVFFTGRANLVLYPKPRGGKS